MILNSLNKFEEFINSSEFFDTVKQYGLTSYDIEIVKKWANKQTKYYNQAIYVWTKLDPEKRKAAKDSKIRYLEIFSIKLSEVVSKYNDYINGLKN